MNTKMLTGWERRKARVRKKVLCGAHGRLRLNVYRSNKHIYAQLIDDAAGGVTVLSASTGTKAIQDSLKKLNKVDAARKVGEYLGKMAKEKGIAKVVFDRSGYLYHGRVKALAEGARVAKLEF